MVHLYVDTAASPPVLKEQTISAQAGGVPPNCTYTGSYATRLVGKYVANSSSTPVFTYYYDDASGVPTAIASDGDPLSAAIGCSSTRWGSRSRSARATTSTCPSPRW